MTMAYRVGIASAFALAALAPLAVSVTAQSRTAPTEAGGAVRPGTPARRAAAGPARRTPDGRPDLQGAWDCAQLTPFERPGAFGEKSVLSDVEAEEFGQDRIARDNKDRRDGTAAQDVERAYNDFWWDFGTHVAKQASLVVDPPSGRLPALTADAQKKAASRTPKYDNVEERPLAERCILGVDAAPLIVTATSYGENVVPPLFERALP